MILTILVLTALAIYRSDCHRREDDPRAGGGALVVFGGRRIVMSSLACSAVLPMRTEPDLPVGIRTSCRTFLLTFRIHLFDRMRSCPELTLQNSNFTLRDHRFILSLRILHH